MRVHTVTRIGGTPTVAQESLDNGKLHYAH